MAPFPIHRLQPQPDLGIRQDGSSPFLITLSITRATTTYTTTMILGSATDSPSNPTTTETIATASPTQILIPATSPESTDRGAIIGGVLGAFLGLFVLAALFWKCCYDNRSALWAHRRRSSYSDSDSNSTSSSRSSRIRRRGGGRSDFGRRNRRGDRVRRPGRVYVRREKERERNRSRSGTRSSISKSERYRSRRGSGTRGMMYKNGVLGWPLGFTVKPRYVETRERWSSSGKGSRHGGANLRFNVGDD